MLCPCRAPARGLSWAKRLGKNPFFDAKIGVDSRLDAWHLLALGVSLKTAIQHRVSSKSYWHMAQTPALQQALSNEWLNAQGLVSVNDLWCKAQGYTT